MNGKRIRGSDQKEYVLYAHGFFLKAAAFKELKKPDSLTKRSRKLGITQIRELPDDLY
jgi:hypothetical protein